MVNDTEKKIKRIANKCLKAKIPFEFTVGNPYQYEFQIKDKNGTLRQYSIDLVDINVDCKLKHNGWSVLGVVKRTDQITQCYFDDHSLCKEYSTTDFHCDHCNKHVHRNSVVVLENEDGKRMIVGTSCVKEFTRGLDGAYAIAYADLAFDLETNTDRLYELIKRINQSEVVPYGNGDVTNIDELWDIDEMDLLLCSIRKSICHDVHDVLACAACSIREDGFKSTYNINATWKQIPFYLDRFNFVSEADKQEADEAIEWITSLTDEQCDSCYLFNLRQIVLTKYCSQKHFGMLASLIPTYHKDLSKRTALKTETYKKQSNFVGNIGEKTNSEVIVTAIIPYETQWGQSHIILMSDNNGNILKWNTSVLWKLNKTTKICVGSKYNISYTIKSHDEYKGDKQTSITRCKVLNA